MSIPDDYEEIEIAIDAEAIDWPGWLPAWLRMELVDLEQGAELRHCAPDLLEGGPEVVEAAGLLHQQLVALRRALDGGSVRRLTEALVSTSATCTRLDAALDLATGQEGAPETPVPA